MQHVIDCPDHDDCTAIYWEAKDGDPSIDWDGKKVVWHSHLHSDIHAEHRINPDHPAADLRSGKAKTLKPTKACHTCTASEHWAA